MINSTTDAKLQAIRWEGFTEKSRNLTEKFRQEFIAFLPLLLLLHSGF